MTYPLSITKKTLTDSTILREPNTPTNLTTNQNAIVPLERNQIQSLSRINPNTSKLIERSIQRVQNTVNQVNGLTVLGFTPFLKTINNTLNSNNTPKQLIAIFTGGAMLLTGVVSGLRTIFDILSGKERGTFKPGELLSNAMIGWLGYDAIQYAQGKNDSLNSTKSIIQRIIPILFLKGFNSAISNPNSASYKITNAIGLNGPMSSLTKDLINNINPNRLLGWKIKNDEGSPWVKQ
jgi:hypothetical protein